MPAHAGTRALDREEQLDDGQLVQTIDCSLRRLEVLGAVWQLEVASRES